MAIKPCDRCLEPSCHYSSNRGIQMTSIWKERINMLLLCQKC